MPGALWFKSRGHGRLLKIGIIARLGFARRNISDGRERAAVVEPIDPFERGELDDLKVAPRPPVSNDFGSVEPVGSLCEYVVGADANAVDGGFKASLGYPFGVFDRHALNRRDQL